VIEPGTFGVVASPGFVPGAIRLTTRSPFSHAFVVVEGGMIVEAQQSGAELNPLDKYSRSKDTALAFNDEEPLTAEQRAGIVAHAMSLLGVPYGFLDIVGLGMNAWLHWEPKWLVQRIQSQKRLICSQLVSRSFYLGAGIDLACGRPDAMVTPGDLGLRITERLWEVPRVMSSSVTPVSILAPRGEPSAADHPAGQ
jgi:uncharacterized protein YycO